MEAMGDRPTVRSFDHFAAQRPSVRSSRPQAVDVSEGLETPAPDSSKIAFQLFVKVRTKKI